MTSQDVRRFRAGGPGARLDIFLAGRCRDLSRSRLRGLIECGMVTVGGESARPSRRLREGDEVAVVVPPVAPPAEPQPEEMALSVVYRDEDLLVVDKPPGLTVHPAPGHPRGTLVNALLHACPELREMGAGERPGIVHRLDRDTSGLMAVARNERAHRALVAQFKERRVRKGYLALAWGRPSPSTGVIEAPVGRNPRDRKRMAVVEGGREATTRYRTLRRYRECSLLEVTPFTGRTHQVRVHLAHIGHPLVGDRVYGRRRPRSGRQFLHAHRLVLRLPASGGLAEFRAQLPPDLKRMLQHQDVAVPGATLRANRRQCGAPLGSVK